MEMVCASCGDAFGLHCFSETCNWLACKECQLIVGANGAIPTWERYVAEGRNEAK